MITVSIMQLASVRNIIAEAEQRIFDETNAVVKLTIIDREADERLNALVIRNFVCTMLGISASDIAAASRRAHLVEARRIVAALSKDYTASSYREIAGTMGERDHSTAVHLYNSAYALLDCGDEHFCAKYHMVHRAFIQQFLNGKDNAAAEN